MANPIQQLTLRRELDDAAAARRKRRKSEVVGGRGRGGGGHEEGELLLLLDTVLGVELLLHLGTDPVEELLLLLDTVPEEGNLHQLLDTVLGSLRQSPAILPQLQDTDLLLHPASLLLLLLASLLPLLLVTVGHRKSSPCRELCQTTNKTSPAPTYPLGVRQSIVPDVRGIVLAGY